MSPMKRKRRGGPRKAPVASLPVEDEDVEMTDANANPGIKQMDNLLKTAVVQMRELDIVRANKHLNAIGPKVNNVVETESPNELESEDENESENLPVSDNNIQGELPNELGNDESEPDSSIRNLSEDSDEIEEVCIGAAALAVVNFPNNIEKWGPIPNEDIETMKSCIMKDKEYQNVLTKLTGGKELSEVDKKLHCKLKYSLKEGYLKPSPYFVYEDSLKEILDTAESSDSDNTDTVENLNSEESNYENRVEYYRDAKRDYLNLLDIPNVGAVPKSPPLPPVEVIKEHSKLLEQQIKELVQIMQEQGKISQGLGELIVSISEKKKMTEEVENAIKEDEEASTFITENGIDTLLDDYK